MASFKWFFPFLFLGIIAPFTPALDMAVARFFFQPSEGTFYNDVCMRFLFRYGEYFAFATGGGAALAFLLSFVRPKWKKWRRGSLILVLTFFLGAGVITNTLLKGHWGRPRPKQLIEFGGNTTYRPFWRPDFHAREPRKSFPSGHVAMGFYFLSFCLVGKRHHNRALFASGVFLTIALGGSLMITRVAQGGHFVSDVLASILLMWIVALAVDKITWEGWEKVSLFLKNSDTSQVP